MVVIDDGFGSRVVIQGVDREIAARSVFQLATEDIVAQHPTLLVGERLVAALFSMVAAESGHFDGFCAHADMHDLETTADDAGAAEAVTDLFRRRIGGDIEVLRRQADQQVAHGAADDVRLVAIFLQGLDGASATPTDVLTLQAMLGDGDDCRFAMLAGVFASEDAGDELADHCEWLLLGAMAQRMITDIATAGGRRFPDRLTRGGS
ncbi:MAG: hypothetical protein AW09_001221 [Candidatus Accumulibacter phosphatis]|uniref:Uncharacterized protein n=1 Tax=Candidatus Accumulibacter phosphatis TaxID=327160 RepID=A0A080LZQ4_9PROT|nr:MAG: hypothetical protein AW09_001221 [Candidatus Accumulibacter phosphatis]